MLREILSSFFWGAALFVIQIALNLIKSEPIDWKTTILASVMLIVIHFFVSRGRTTIEDTNKKTGSTTTAASKKSIAEKATRKANQANQKQEDAAKETAMGKRGFTAEDLKFYLYNRNAKLAVFAGLICLMIWYLKSSSWFLYVGISFFGLAMIYYVFFVIKRKEFVEKQRKEKDDIKE